MKQFSKKSVFGITKFQTILKVFFKTKIKLILMNQPINRLNKTL